MGQIVVLPPAEDELVALGASLAKLESAPLATRLADGLARLSDAAQNGAWSASSDQQVWQGFIKGGGETASTDGYKGRLTDYLSRLMCRSRFASGAVATGVARRAMAPGFQGDLPALYVRLKGGDCAATPAMSPRLMRDLATAADASRENAAMTPAQGRAP
jgi:hypothetical protein